MNENDTTFFDDLKGILKNIRSPERLNDHPWTQSLIVRAALAANPHLTETEPGQQLVSALAGLFCQMQPAAPPRRGKRLDPRWGEFGLLAALYFTPFNHGQPYPTTLMDACARIDAAILHAVYGKSIEELPEEEVKKFELIGADVDYAAASTLSDWHKKGVQRFTELILNRERLLARTSAQSSTLLHPNGKPSQPALQDPAAPEHPRRMVAVRIPYWLRISLLLLLIAFLSLSAFKLWKIYTQGMVVYQDVTVLRGLARGPADLESLRVGIPALKSLQMDLAAFQAEVRPLLWLPPYLKWIPTYGNDLSSAPALLDTAEHLVNTALMSYQAAEPLLNELGAQNSSLGPAGLTLELVEAQPRLLQARAELDQALTARQSIPAKELSPRLSRLVREELDPLLRLADNGIGLALTLPHALGATSEGPQTYLLLVQNEDELRPTGGFITAIGTLVVHQGQVISLQFEDAGLLEDWSKPYPAAPWQLQQYMNSPVLVLRDSNWYPDFPTVAQWAEYLYAYTNSHSVNGIIAVNQHFLVMLLGELGPVDVESAPYPITQENVIGYMREAKIPPEAENRPTDWSRKDFIAELAGALLEQMTSGSHDWKGLTTVLLQAVEERHLLLQLDHPVLSDLLVQHGWDNAIRPPDGDFLLVMDTNIGFNKTNAVVETSLSYDVDLTDLSAPVATLFVTHQNNARKHVPCIHWSGGILIDEPRYPINRCYWNYLRVYKQEGVQLSESSAHAVPAGWMIRGEAVPARVDVLDAEELPGVQGFGTLLVVPGSDSLSTSFKFALPPEVLSAVQGEFTYRLRVQKQPGTLAVPIVIRLHLPNQATVQSISAEAVAQDNHLLIQTSLQRDVELNLVFRVP